MAYIYATYIRVVIINLGYTEFTVWKSNIFTVYNARLQNRMQRIKEYIQYIYITVFGK